MQVEVVMRRDRGAVNDGICGEKVSRGEGFFNRRNP